MRNLVVVFSVGVVVVDDENKDVIAETVVILEILSYYKIREEVLNLQVEIMVMKGENCKDEEEIVVKVNCKEVIVD